MWALAGSLSYATYIVFLRNALVNKFHKKSFLCDNFLIKKKEYGMYCHFSFKEYLPAY